jgi:cell volume regulation protein A
MEIESVFFLIGVITIIGYLASNIFARTSIPDIPFLILLGIIASSLLGGATEGLQFIAPYLASVAIAVILFNGGMYLKIRQVIAETPKGFLVTATSVLLAILSTSVFGLIINNYILDSAWGVGLDALLPSLFFGAALAGTSSAVIIPLVSRLKVDKKLETFLTIESAFTDVFVIVIGVTILNIIVSPGSSDTISITTFLQGIAGKFSIGIVFGLIGGLIWLYILQSFPKNTGKISSQYDIVHDDVLTLTTMLMLYGISEISGGNGALAALCFGLVLGNGKDFGFIPSFQTTPVDAGSLMRKFQGQISFLLATFFFVYLGMIFKIGIMILILGILVTILLFGSRYLALYTTVRKNRTYGAEIKFLSLMLPRGLAAAAVSQLPINYGINLPYMQDLVVSVIIFSVLVSAIGSFIYAKNNPPEPPISPKT